MYVCRKPYMCTVVWRYTQAATFPSTASNSSGKRGECAHKLQHSLLLSVLWLCDRLEICEPHPTKTFVYTLQVPLLCCTARSGVLSTYSSSIFTCQHRFCMLFTALCLYAVYLFDAVVHWYEFTTFSRRIDNTPICTVCEPKLLDD